MSPDERFAALDVGTNTVLLLIAELQGGEPVPLVERARITRLGGGVDRTGRIDDDAAERTLACLRDYGDELRAHGVTHAAGVCTSAARDAVNGAAFLAKARAELGFPLHIIDGQREALLTFAGALSGLGVEGPVTVFDIGGGSTEIISGTSIRGVPAVRSAVSLDVGSVRLTERFVRNDPPSEVELGEMRACIRSELEKAAPPGVPAELIGVAGTMTTLSAIDQNLATYDSSKVHGSRLEGPRVQSLLAQLSSLDHAARVALPGLEPGRADVIVAGALIAAEVLRWSGAGHVRVSDRGVRWGLLFELVGRV